MRGAGEPVGLERFVEELKHGAVHANLPSCNTLRRSIHLLTSRKLTVRAPSQSNMNPRIHG